jgi:dipeptidyl aminopeptidase/acylaminoacyl peptidase
VHGGESEKITDVKSGVNAYKWSKDGQSIAVLLADHTAEDEEKNTKSKMTGILWMKN